MAPAELHGWSPGHRVEQNVRDGDSGSGRRAIRAGEGYLDHSIAGCGIWRKFVDLMTLGLAGEGHRWGLLARAKRDGFVF